LGLAISRDIVVAHGGLLVAESQPGQGATFRVVLSV
ncbi:MAG: cell wall metabolism sensor histidine kinase WalK, partial [Chloroflexi bacterium]|nr:cell wall metabolism sensor histidine kinase WalK [Chloroflexota bacterium]